MPGKSLMRTVAQAIACFAAAAISALGVFITFQLGWTVWCAVLASLAIISTIGWIAMLVRPMRAANRSVSEAGRIAAMISAGVLWVCAVALLLFSLAYLASEEIIAVWFVPVFLALLVMIVSQFGRAVRRRRATVVLGYVEQAVRLDLPLPPMIRAAAQSEGHKTGWRLLALHDELDRGQSLEQALRRSVPEVQPATLRAVGAAGRVGRLPHMLRRLAAADQWEVTPESELTALYRIYPIFVLLVAIATGGVLIPVVVWPKFFKILHDFHQTPPWTMRAMTRLVGPPFGAVGPVGVLILMGLVALAPTGRYLARLFFPTRLDPPFGGLVRDQLIWWTPVLHGDALDRGMADLCDFISDAADAGRPIDQALREARQTQANAVMRFRVAQWADAIERGQPLHEAARLAEMPGLMVAMLATVRNTDDLGEIFSFLHRHYEFRFSRRRELLRALYIPFVVMLMGALVLLIELSIFQPLIALITAEARLTGGF